MTLTRVLAHTQEYLQVQALTFLYQKAAIFHLPLEFEGFQIAIIMVLPWLVAFQSQICKLQFYATCTHIWPAQGERPFLLEQFRKANTRPVRMG
ncbi:hypothetical protein GY14_24690 [Delftia tsuruhatensis]|nr:hypothetical protein GY14_24690 [Delftia tsuruhatensis]